MSFSFQGRKVTLKPLSPQEVHEDQIKMKSKRENEKAKEVSNKPSHNILSTKLIMLTHVMLNLSLKGILLLYLFHYTRFLFGYKMLGMIFTYLLTVFTF